MAFDLIEKALALAYKYVTVRCKGRGCGETLRGWKQIRRHAMERGHAGSEVLDADFSSQGAGELVWLRGPEAGLKWAEAAELGEETILQGTRELAKRARLKVECDAAFRAALERECAARN